MKNNKTFLLLISVFTMASCNSGKFYFNKRIDGTEISREKETAITSTNCTAVSKKNINDTIQEIQNPVIYMSEVEREEKNEIKLLPVETSFSETENAEIRKSENTERKIQSEKKKQNNKENKKKGNGWIGLVLVILLTLVVIIIIRVVMINMLFTALSAI